MGMVLTSILFAFDELFDKIVESWRVLGHLLEWGSNSSVRIARIPGYEGSVEIPYWTHILTKIHLNNSKIDSNIYLHVWFK